MGIQDGQAGCLYKAALGEAGADTTLNTHLPIVWHACPCTRAHVHTGFTRDVPSHRHPKGMATLRRKNSSRGLWGMERSR